jgi:hypothetical protein
MGQNIFATPSPSPSPRRSISSTPFSVGSKRQRTASLAPSDYSEGTLDWSPGHRLTTEDYDDRVGRRTKRPRDREPVAGRDSVQPTVLASMPAAIDGAISTVIDTVGVWYVEDIDNDDAGGKTAFKRSCIESLVDTLFQGGDQATVASSIGDELSQCSSCSATPN